MKRIIQRIFVCSALSMLGFFGMQSAFALNFSNAYFFGDSLSDIGNRSDAPRSNGSDLWSKDLAGKLGFNLRKSTQGGTDYAYSGADSILDKTTPENTPSILTQVNTAIAAAGGRLDSNALYSVWGGANDFLDVISKYPAQPTKQQQAQEAAELMLTSATTPQNMASILNSLHSAGAKYLIAMNLPYLGETPMGQHNAALDAITLLYNDNLLKDVNALGFDVIQIDVQGLFEDLLSNPESFGFSNVSGTCIGQSSCAGYLFYDAVHPTVAAHAVIADLVMSVLAAPQYYAALAESPFAILKSQNDTIKQQLDQQMILGGYGQTHFFVSGGYTPSGRTAVASDRNSDHNDNKAVTVGVLYPTNEHMLLGLAFGYTHSNTQLSHNAFEYNTNASTVSFFGRYHFSHLYVDGIANYDYLDYNDIKRPVVLGPRTITPIGSTEGKHYGVALDAGYMLDFLKGSLKTGPIMNVAYQKVFVDGYSEGGSGVGGYAKIEYQNQNNDSLITGIGWQAAYKYLLKNANKLSLNVYATGNQQWRDGERNIRFHVESLSGSHASLPVNSEETNTPYYTFLSTGATLGFTFKNDMTVSLGFVGDYGSHDKNNSMFDLNFDLPV